MQKNESIEEIKLQLIELGAKIESHNDNQIKFRFALEDTLEQDITFWAEIGFLLGQWAFLLGIEFPRDFPNRNFMGSPKLRFDASPGGFYFLFPRV